MKYTIMGFSQRQAQELRLDTTDLLILRWISDFAGTERIKKIVVDGKQYFWIQYAGLLSDLPILSMKKDTLYRRLAKLENKQVLERVTYRENGTYSLYRFGVKYALLVDDDIAVKKSENQSEKNPTPPEKNPEGYGKKSRRGTEKNPDQKINLLINPSTKNKKDACSPQNITEQPSSAKKNDEIYSSEFEEFGKYIRGEKKSGRHTTVTKQQLKKGIRRNS